MSAADDISITVRKESDRESPVHHSRIKRTLQWGSVIVDTNSVSWTYCVTLRHLTCWSIQVSVPQKPKDTLQSPNLKSVHVKGNEGTVRAREHDFGLWDKSSGGDGGAAATATAADDAAHFGQQGTHGQTAFNRNSVYNTLRIVYKKDIKIMDVTSSYL